MEKLNKFFKFLIYILPAVLFFSYYPVIGLGANGSMNFELSLPLLWLILFDVVGLVLMARKKILFRHLKKQWLWVLFPIWLLLSVFWSLNFLRGLLTVGILYLIYFAGYAMWSLRDAFDNEFKGIFGKWFFSSTLIVCVWCVLQCVLDLAGVSRETSLMCEGCTYVMFGFPHPNGFTMEPQFMGNLLLSPTIVVAWLSLKGAESNVFREWLSRTIIFSRDFRKSLKILFPFILLFIFTATLFLTFSRGAIYSLVVGLLFMTVYLIVREKKTRNVVVKRVGLMWGLVVLSFLFTLNLQGLMAQVSPTDDTYSTGVTKVLHHLSLGVIDVRYSEEQPVKNYVENSEDKDEKKSVFDGYVAGSTDTRIKLSNMAMKIWSKDVRTMFFGVGLGGAGEALYVNGFTYSAKEIVQNQYVSLLVETGVIGVLLLILTLVLVVRFVIKNSVDLLGLLVTYGISLLFFSGLPNALHIYLLPMILILISVRNLKKSSR